MKICSLSVLSSKIETANIMSKNNKPYFRKGIFLYNNPW